MPVKFTQGDLATASGLERVLRQFEEAIGQTTATVSPAPSKLPLPVTVSSSSGGGGGGGGTPVIPLPELTLIDTHANRLAIYNPNNYNVGRQFFESDRTVLYVLEVISGSKVWRFVAGAYVSTFANRPADLGVNDSSFLFYATDTDALYLWDGTIWNFIGGSQSTYTPAHTNLTNLTTTTPRVTTYDQTGNGVHVYGEFNAQPTAAALTTSFEMSLPVASNFANTFECGGAGASDIQAGYSVRISGNVANNTALVSWVSADITDQPISFEFGYRVI